MKSSLSLSLSQHFAKLQFIIISLTFMKATGQSNIFMHLVPLSLSDLRLQTTLKIKPKELHQKGGPWQGVHPYGHMNGRRKRLQRNELTRRVVSHQGGRSSEVPLKTNP